MNDNNNIKKRNRNPEARQKAFEEKFLNQVFGDFRCTAVSIEQIEYAEKIHNYPILTLQCSACGSTIKRRADRKFDTLCREDRCGNAAINKQARAMIKGLKKAGDYDQKFLEFENFKAWLLSRGYKPGDTRTIRRPDRSKPLSAENAMLWEGKGQPGTYQMEDGSFVNLKKVCEERRFPFQTAIKRYYRGKRNLDDVVPPLNKWPEEFTKPWTACYPRRVPTENELKQEHFIIFENSYFETTEAFCERFDLDPYLIDRMWNFDNPETLKGEFYRKFIDNPEYRDAGLDSFNFEYRQWRARILSLYYTIHKPAWNEPNQDWTIRDWDHLRARELSKKREQDDFIRETYEEEGLTGEAAERAAEREEAEQAAEEAGMETEEEDY